MLIDVLILNYNGAHLLAECLPSVVTAMRASQHRCRLGVVDNGSSDGSLALLTRRFPEASLHVCTNRGLASFNDVVAGLDSRVVLLVNNDIKLAADAIDPLVEPWRAESAAKLFMTAPRCFLFDGRTYEGLKTAVRWRHGLVQATALFEGHEQGIERPGPTASAGAVLAVDRAKFVGLGGFDPLYLPGRLEDLDLCFRAHQVGYESVYVPTSVSYHRGAASFGQAFGQSGCDHLALRNTLLFQWKNLRHPRSLARQLAGLPLRMFRDLVAAAWQPSGRRLRFLRALTAASKRWREGRDPVFAPAADRRARRERGWFLRFHPHRINHPCVSAQIPDQGGT